MSMLGAVVLARPATLMAQGCAMCTTLAGGPGDPLGAGLNTSIAFLMAMPFVLTASVGAWIVYMYWRGRGEREPVRPLQPRGEEAS
jgi:hypothetical protein